MLGDSSLRSRHLLRPLAYVKTWGSWQSPGLKFSGQAEAAHQSDAVQAGQTAVRTLKQARLEAALLCAEGPVSRKKLVEAALLVDMEEVDELVEQLNAIYDVQKTPFRVESVARGLQLMTRSDYVMWISSLHEQAEQRQMGQAMMETLTIIAYRQPVTRAEVESLRGVQSAILIKQLMERDLVKIVGEEQTLGRPYLYGTTSSFLHEFGLRSLNELPNAHSLKRTSTAEVTQSDAA